MRGKLLWLGLLLLATPNWMQFNRDIEQARHKWREAHQPNKKKDGRSLAAQILDY